MLSKNHLELLLPLLIAAAALLNPFSISTGGALLAQNNMALLSQYYYPDGMSSLWGYAANGREYALAGVKSGLSIVDITNPTQPVELHFVPQIFSEWREIKTWSHYAYIVTEAAGEGVLIVNLENLPASIDTVHFFADGQINRAHTVWTDENGFLYVMGFNNITSSIPTQNRGVAIFDLNPNPMQPTPVISYGFNYAHDAFVRENRMYISEIYVGQMRMLDITDKTAPVTLATWQTPNAFPHNAWPSDNNQFLFTTDERNGAYLSSYDISDPSDVRLLDVYHANDGSNSMPHNAHVKNDFIILSHYTDGVRVIDGHIPDALVETEYYDTSPNSGSGSSGCWGVYQDLPSGIILASDRQQGLFMIQPQYQRAAYLEGYVTDAVSGQAISNVKVSIVSTNYTKNTAFDGHYKMGAANAGMYSILFEKYGYQPLTLNDISLQQALITTLNAQMQPLQPFVLQISAIDEAGNNLPNTQLQVRNSWANGTNGYYTLTTDPNGIAFIEGLFDDTYTLTAHHWGNLPQYNMTYTANNANPMINLVLQRGYYDDFHADLGWQSSLLGSTDPLVGQWIRATPVPVDGTCLTPNDLLDDVGTECFTTGNSYDGAPANIGYLNNATTMLQTPPITTLNYYAEQPILKFGLWLCSGASPGANVKISVQAERDGTTSTLQEYTHNASGLNHQGWVNIEIPLPDWASAVTADTPPLYIRWIAEANEGETAISDFAIDDVQIINASLGGGQVGAPNLANLAAYPTLFDRQTSIYYNPENNNLAQLPQELQIFDLAGRLLYSAEIRPRQTLVWGENVPAGMYLIKMGAAVLRVVKK